jgi:hypothetical protein
MSNPVASTSRSDPVLIVDQLARLERTAAEQDFGQRERESLTQLGRDVDAALDGGWPPDHPARPTPEPDMSKPPRTERGAQTRAAA